MELAIILMMLLIVVSLGAIKLASQDTGYPFKRRQQLFTPVEHSFLNLIESAVGHEFRVICRVKLTDLVSLRATKDKKQANLALSKAGSKQLDFVLVRRDDMTPVMAIDLVHKTESGGHKAQKDWFVTGALENANLPHARIKVKSGYTVEDIRECVETKLVPYRRNQQRMAQAGVHNPTPNTRPTRPVRSSRTPAAA